MHICVYAYMQAHLLLVIVYVYECVSLCIFLVYTCIIDIVSVQVVLVDDYEISRYDLKNIWMPT